MKLDRHFFERPAPEVAQDLLGCFFIREAGKNKIVGKIIETEAYGDASDLASHARFGITKRNKIMFGSAGVLYVYHIYGIFYLTNIICEKEGKAGAVLIRAAEIIKGQNLAKANLAKSKFVRADQKLAIGPGKFSLAFGIDKGDNGLDLVDSELFYILNDNMALKSIRKYKRVGIDYAGHCKDLLWRFSLN